MLAVIPPVCRHEYIATLDKAGRQPAPFVRFARDRVCETQKELMRLMGQPITLGDEGVSALLDAVRANSGRRANELAALVGKSAQMVGRYVGALKDAGKIEFRGAPKNGGCRGLETLEETEEHDAMDEKRKDDENPIVIYTSQDGRVHVNVWIEGETAWLTQVCSFFGCVRRKAME